MKKTLLLLLLVALSPAVFAQQFSQYNTETLFDSFENTSQRSFVRDSSNKYAFNFFVPNFGANAFFTGNAQTSLRSRLFDQKYSNAGLRIGERQPNYLNTTFNTYLIMFKVYTDLRGDQEVGFSWQTRGEAAGMVTDETIAIFNGSADFDNRAYSNIFNSNGYYQAYHQIGFSYRERVSKKVALGAKLSLLLGIQHQKLVVHNSYIDFDKQNDQADLSLAATYHRSYGSGVPSGSDLVPSFRNPGASINLGGSYKAENGLVWQGNIKDLGFIHWSGRSEIRYIDGTQTFTNLSTPAREDSVKSQGKQLLRKGLIDTTSYITPTNGIAEISVAKKFWLNDDHTLRLLPTFIVQKQLFYKGITGALVGHLQYNNWVGTLTSSYNDLRLFNFGGQVMYKTPNFEFYLGSERLWPTKRVAVQQVTYNSSYTGADVFLGFSVKFGSRVESRMNSSYMPMGEEKGFLARLFDHLF